MQISCSPARQGSSIDYEATDCQDQVKLLSYVEAHLEHPFPASQAPCNSLLQRHGQRQDLCSKGEHQLGSHSQGLSSRNRVVTAKPFVLCHKAKVLFIELCLIVSFSRGVLVSKRHCHCLRISMPTFSCQTPKIEASLPSLCPMPTVCGQWTCIHA